jgi:hypothetical protein
VVEITLVSVPELLMVELQSFAEIADAAPGGVMVGPAKEEEFSIGCVSLAEVGFPVIEKYLPLVRARLSIRCIAPSLRQVELISRAVIDKWHLKNRRSVRQPSSGKLYLVHYTTIVSGPNMTPDETGTWFQETLFVETMVGTEPIPE